MIHELKTIPVYFNAVKNGSKPFEVRKNDRDFREDDILLLREYIPKDYHEACDEARYTGEILTKKVTYVLYGGRFGIEPGYVVMGLQNYSLTTYNNTNFRLLNVDEIIDGNLVFLIGSDSLLHSLIIVSDCNFNDENTQLCKTEAKYYQEKNELYTLKK